MPTVQELRDRLDTLRQNRAMGVLVVRLADGRSTTFKTDAEMGAAAADLERQIAALTTTPITTIHVAATKGLEAE